MENSQNIDLNKTTDLVGTTITEYCLEPLPTPSIDELNTIFREYNSDIKLDELIGKGGNGLVYKIKQSPLAIKVLNPFAKVYKKCLIEDIKEGFYNEWKIGKDLSIKESPRIVKIYNYFGKEEELPYFFMDHINGKTLEDKIYRQGIQEKELLINVIQAVEGLEFLHKNNVVHGDIKPSNILIDGLNQNAKLADFGLSHKLTNENLKPKGLTRAYSAPEQENQESVILPKTDIYSIGLILFESFKKGRFKRKTHENDLAHSGRDSYEGIPDSVKKIVQDCVNLEISPRPSATKLKQMLLNITGDFNISNEELNNRTLI